MGGTISPRPRQTLLGPWKKKTNRFQNGRRMPRGHPPPHRPPPPQPVQCHEARSPSELPPPRPAPTEIRFSRKTSDLPHCVEGLDSPAICVCDPDDEVSLVAGEIWENRIGAQMGERAVGFWRTWVKVRVSKSPTVVIHDRSG